LHTLRLLRVLRVLKKNAFVNPCAATTHKLGCEKNSMLLRKEQYAFIRLYVCSCTHMIMSMLAYVYVYEHVYSVRP
jgi:hypothetical protein